MERGVAILVLPFAAFVIIMTGDRASNRQRDTDFLPGDMLWYGRWQRYGRPHRAFALLAEGLWMAGAGL